MRVVVVRVRVDPNPNVRDPPRRRQALNLTLTPTLTLTLTPTAGILHGDVKPDNMAMGRGPKANEVFLLDFGLARYYRDAMTLIHHPPEYGAGKTGNYRYSSLRSHAGDVAPSRRDDLESLAYVLIMLIKGACVQPNPNPNPMSHLTQPSLNPTLYHT